MKRSRLALTACIAAAPVIFFHEICLGGRTYLLRDLFSWFHPWRIFAADSLSRGEFPLWNPYSYAGTPFLANMQSGLLYPPNLVFWLLDFPSALRLFLVVQFALCAWFMHMLLRAHGCRTASCLAGAFGYAYGGWMIVHIEFPNKLAAAAWLPLILLGLTHWWQGRPARGLIVGALAMACCVTAGYPQTTFTLLIGALVIWCGALVAAPRGARRKGASGAGPLGVACSLPAVVALGALIGAAQVVPFLEALSLSVRSVPFDPDQVLSLRLSPWHFLDLIAPRIFGLPGYQNYWGGFRFQYWIGHFHVGILPLLLAAAGLLSGRTGARRCGALLLFAALFCLGDRTPLAPLCVAWLPGFGHFKWLPTTSILVAFPLCWLAALGLDRVFDDIEGRARLSRAVTVGAVAIAALGVSWAGLAGLAPGWFEAVARALVSPVALPTQRELIAENLGPARADAMRAGAIVLVAVVAWLVARSGRTRAALFGGLVPLLVFLDLMGAASGVNHAGDPGIYREVPPNVAALRSRADPLFRIYVPDETLGQDLSLYGSRDAGSFRWAADTLLFNLNLPWHLFSASDGDPMVNARWRNFHRLIEREGPESERARLLSIANVGVVLLGSPGAGTRMMDLPVHLPRVYVAAGARRVGAGRALATMLAPGWDPALEVLVEEDFRAAARPPDGGPVDHVVRRVAYTSNTVAIEVQASRSGYLVLGDANYPGWEATIDGSPAPVFTANHLFRGVDLPAGSHEVRFVYRPASVRWGAAGSIVGLLAVSGLGFIARRGAPAPP